MPVESDITGPQRVPLPLGGVANASTYRDQPTRFLPSETTRNIRPFDGGKDRPRLGTCPGIVKLLVQQFGNGSPIQALDTVGRASVISGYHLGDHAIILGRSSLAGPVAGQLFGFSPGNEPALNWVANVDLTGEGGPASIALVAVARHPDTDLVVAVTAPYTNGSDPHNVCRVYAFDGLGNAVWNTKISSASADINCRAIAVSRLYTLVCANEKVYALRNDTGANITSTNCNQWSSEAVAVRFWRDPTSLAEFAYILFNGSTTSTGSGNLPNGGALTAGFYAECFRSGVMKFLLPRLTYAQTPVFTQVQWGRQLASTDADYEASHGYFRIADNSVLKPRGAIVNDLCIDPAGNLYIARCNAGGGPRAAYTPDLAVVRPITVMKVSRLGGTVWEKDTDSIIRVGSQGVLNDISTGAGIEPSIAALAADGTNVYAGGAPNAATFCAFAMAAQDGSLRWGATLEATVGPPNDTIRQGGVAVDPTDGHPIFSGSNTTAYGGGGSPAAHALKLNSVDGSTVWIVNEGAVSGYGVVVFLNGRIAMATGEV